MLTHLCGHNLLYTQLSGLNMGGKIWSNSKS
jgi:hypothetical protein